MKNADYTMEQHVARTICAAAQHAGVCLHCIDETDCVLWPTFMKEAKGAIEAVRDFAMISKRNKPRLREPEEIANVS